MKRTKTKWPNCIQSLMYYWEFQAELVYISQPFYIIKNQIFYCITLYVRNLPNAIAPGNHKCLFELHFPELKPREKKRKGKLLQWVNMSFSSYFHFQIRITAGTNSTNSASFTLYLLETMLLFDEGALSEWEKNYTLPLYFSSIITTCFQIYVPVK